MASACPGLRSQTVSLWGALQLSPTSSLWAERRGAVKQQGRLGAHKSAASFLQRRQPLEAHCFDNQQLCTRHELAAQPACCSAQHQAAQLQCEMLQPFSSQQQATCHRYWLAGATFLAAQAHLRNPSHRNGIYLEEVPHLSLDCAKRSGPAWCAGRGSLCTAWRLSTSHAPVSSLTSSCPEGLNAMLESTPDTSGTRHRDCSALAGSGSRVKTYLQEVTE